VPSPALIVVAVGGLGSIGGSFAARANVTVTEEPMTAGFYEAVVRSLAEG